MHEYLITYAYTPSQRLTSTESGNLRPVNSRTRLTARLVLHKATIRQALEDAQSLLIRTREQPEILSIVKQ